jgi:hypothetical protein
MMNLKTIAAGVTITGALGFTALGMGAGVANAVPPLTPGTPWQQDEGHGHGHGDGGDWGDNGGWRGGGNWDQAPWGGGGPGYGGLIGCISGPVGWGTGFLCI